MSQSNSESGPGDLTLPSGYSLVPVDEIPGEKAPKTGDLPAGYTAQPVSEIPGDTSFTMNPGAGDYDVQKEMKLLGYEGARGASFGLSDLAASPKMKKEGEAFEARNPVTAMGAQIAGGLVPGFMAPETIPWMGAAATTPQRIIANAGFGAVAGGLSGAMEGEGNPYANATRGAVTGAGVGGLLGAIAGKIQPTVSRIVSGNSPNYVKQQAASLIASKIAQDAQYGSPTASAMADALDRANTIGSPLGAMDLGGENLTGLAGNLYRSPGAARPAIGNYFKARDVDATGRLMDAIDNSVATGAKTSDEAIQENLAKRTVDAGPLYRALYDRYPVVSSDRLNQFLANPYSRAVMRDGLNQGVEQQGLAAANAGTPFDPNAYTLDFNAAGDPVWKGTPNLQTWDTVKQGLDGLLKGSDYRNDFGQLTAKGRQISQLRGNLVDELDRLTTSDPQSGSDYALARSAWAGPSRANEMVLEGANWMKKDPGELQREVAGLNPSDRDFYLLGVANDMRKRVLTQTGEGNEANRILNSPMAKKQAAAIFQPDDYQTLVDRVENERTAFKTWSTVGKGSQAAGRHAEDTANQPGHGPGLAAPLYAEVIAHDPHIGIPFAALSYGKKLLDWARQPSPAVRTEAARVLTGSTADQAQALRGIAGMQPAVPRVTQALTSGIAGTTLPRVPYGYGDVYNKLPAQHRGGVIGANA